jgi:hypothetical protein
MSNNIKLTKDIFNAFKRRGLSLTSDSSKDLARQLKDDTDKLGSLSIILDTIRARIEKREIKSSLISKDIITSVILELTATEKDLELESTQLLDAFSSPCMSYDEKTKSYNLNSKPQVSIL